MHSQSFSNSFEGVHGVVRKSGRGYSIFLFYCIFMLQFFKVFWAGTWGAPLSPPPLCASMIRIFLIKALMFMLWYFFIKLFQNKNYILLLDRPSLFLSDNHLLVNQENNISTRYCQNCPQNSTFRFNTCVIFEVKSRLWIVTIL